MTTNAEVFIDHEAIERGETFKAMVGYRQADFDVALRRGRFYTMSDCHVKSPEAVVDHVTRYGRSMDFYKVGVCPGDDHIGEYSAWFPIRDFMKEFKSFQLPTALSAYQYLIEQEMGEVE